MSEFTEHFYYLHRLMHHLNLIDEDRYSIESIIQEPTWFQEDSGLAKHELCDLILIYRDGSIRPVELKGTWKRRRANSQIRSGFEYSLEVLKKPKFRRGKSVVYQAEDESYLFELVEPSKSLKKYLID